MPWLLFGWASNLLAIWVASLVFDGVTYDAKFWVLAVAALVFVLVNAIVRPIVVLLALPAVILSFGIALIFVNALMLYITDKIVGPFEVRGSVWTYVGAALIIWLVNMAVHGVFKPERPARPRYEITS
ncbi:MAG TPA: phage holin family protein [Gaiellaceae bacterium]|jgi:putative membrane protein|nr:phage holin family protein [Gaiellaceae bacterium]